jgi:HEAT repeat protein
MAPDQEKKQDLPPDKKTMSVTIDDRSELGRFCWIFLRNALSDAEWRTRACAAWALGVAADRLPQQFLGPALVALGGTATDHDGFVRFWTIDSLGKLGGEQEVPIVRAALNDKDDYVRINAAKALHQLGRQDSSQALIDTLHMTPSTISTASEEEHKGRRQWKLKVFAIECLGEIRLLAAIPHITALLREPHWPVRASSAWALGMIGDKSAIPAIKPLLRDKRKLVCISAAEAVAKLGDESATALLRSALIDEDKSIKYKAAESLAKLGYRTGVNLLADALKDSDIQIRNTAVTALGKLGDVSVVKPLTEMLEDENWQLRADAAVALGRIGEEVALAPVRKLLEDSVRNVRVSAAVAVLMMLGK